jgi:hypothetical protein
VRNTENNGFSVEYSYDKSETLVKQTDTVILFTVWKENDVIRSIREERKKVNF